MRPQITISFVIATLAITVRAATPVVEITAPQCPVWADVGIPLQFVLMGTDQDNDLSYCDMGVGATLVDRKYFSSTNSGTSCTFTYTFTEPGTNLLWFQAFDLLHNASMGAHCTVQVVPPPLSTNFSVLTYNTHLFEDTTLEAVVRTGHALKPATVGPWEEYAYVDLDRRTYIASQIRSLGPDIVALEEVWAYSWREWFKTNLADIYPHSYVFALAGSGANASEFSCGDGLDAWEPGLGLAMLPFVEAYIPNPADKNLALCTLGNGLLLLSKYELSNKQFARFPTYTQGGPQVAQDSWADKGVMTATANVGGNPVRIGMSHALTGPDDYMSAEQDYTAATVFTFQDKRGQSYYFGVTPNDDLGHVTRFEDYSYKDAAAITHHAMGRKPVGDPRSMGYGCSAAATFRLNGEVYFYGLHSSGQAVIRRFNDDPTTGWVTTGSLTRSAAYTCLTSFEYNGEPYIFMNYPPEANAYIYKISPGATNTTLASRTPIGTLASCAFFELNGRPYLLGIHLNNKAVVYRVEDGATNLSYIAEVPWWADWTPTSFALDGQPGIFAQTYAEGQHSAQLWKVMDPNPATWTLTLIPDWNHEPHGCDGVKSFEVAGHPYLIALKACCDQYPDSTYARQRPRQAVIWRVNDDGAGLEPMLQLEDIRMIRDATVLDQLGPPAIMMGDFNVHPSKFPILDNIFKDVQAVDAYLQVHGSPNGGDTIDYYTNVLNYYFTKTNEMDDLSQLISRIDYAYVKTQGNGVDLTPIGAYVIRDWKLPNGWDLSDHYPLVVNFRLQEDSRLQAAPVAGGLCQLGISGTIGRLCEVQYSSDLLAWQKLAEFRITASPHLYTDPTPTQNGRFYRIRLRP